MKNKLLLLMLIFISFTMNSQDCGDCSGDAITHEIGTPVFTSTYAQAYFWEVCDGNAVIVGSNTSQNVTLSCSGCSAGDSSTLKVTQFINGNCVESCLTFLASGCDSGPSDPTCCEPELNAYWISGGWSGGHGGVYIDFTTVDCDTSSVESIDFVLYGAIFVSGPLNGQTFGTIYPPAFFPGNIANYDNSSILIEATIHYNNGCNDSFITQTIESNGSAKKNNVLLYPNPTDSNLKIQIDDFDKKDNVEVIIFDNITGEKIYQKRIKDSNLKIDLKEVVNTKIVKVLILNNKKVIKQSIVIIE